MNQNAEREKNKLTIAVLGIRGANSWGPAAAAGIATAATDVQSVVIPSSGHRVAEQAPVKVLEARDAFLAPYRAAAASAPVVR